ncbi:MULTISPECIES: helix-turn-helix transcriptional regulator [Gordonia]|uniref:AraC family transcriptional regulator n=1 Tax=Gordonia rubripertincta NBRC 101908 TaxID=1077975 RepID=A0ABQ0HNB1_GORRU|nr:helix-turn-helix transcriptional regulator [Gordonia alkanivorans]ASR01314.1 Transcriptional activator FeaR [Gordonia rubripertincta]NKY63339.1 helix-turn-helix transcriptional regulator [Gordonia rubripertincta]QMU22205.1 helix-turn-helix transcriptional regulator [Gordonia rubripertincta]GAB83735.1 putative AraC family transcriptional regulator [Gordonia rubripertincta NBRC 101908]
MGAGPNGGDGQVMSIAPERVSHSERVSRDGVSDLRTSERYLRAAVTDLIERNFRDPDFSVEVVARHLHVSRRHLYRVLAGGPTSLAEMIADRRLEWARRLLTGPGNLKLEAVAHASGFASTATMRNRFRAKFGLTPDEFRRTAMAADAEAS